MNFDRRALLKALSGVPLLHTLMPHSALGAPGTPPKRIVFWFQPMGVAHRHYRVKPGSTALDWGYDGDLHTLAPLIPFRDVTVHFDAQEILASANVVEDWRKYKEASKIPMGLCDLAGCVGPNPLKPNNPMTGELTRELTIGHESPTSLLTGRFPKGTVATSGTTQFVDWSAQGDSFDFALGKALGATTRIQSVQLGASSYVNFGLSYNQGQRLPIVDNPKNAFETLFTGIPRVPGVDPAAAALLKKMRRRKSSFEAAYARFKDLKSTLPAGHQLALQQHLDAYREVETRLTQAPGSTSAACHSPDAPPANLNLADPLKLPDQLQLMMDQTVLALACDVSRVFTLSWTYAATNQIFSFLPGFTAPIGPGGAPSPDGHHPLSHDSYDGTLESVTPLQLANYDKLRRVERWYAERLASFLTALRNVKEADGSTLLDNTLVVVLNEMNHPAAHNNSNLPIRLYGNLQGKIRSGRYLPLPATPLNNLWVSIANAFNLPWTTFGEPRFDFKFASGQTGPSVVNASHQVGPLEGLVNA
jgi:Protein of unknown function (DUF1552)